MPGRYPNAREAQLDDLGPVNVTSPKPRAPSPVPPPPTLFAKLEHLWTTKFSQKLRGPTIYPPPLRDHHPVVRRKKAEIHKLQVRLDNEIRLEEAAIKAREKKLVREHAVLVWREGSRLWRGQAREDDFGLFPRKMRSAREEQQQEKDEIRELVVASRKPGREAELWALRDELETVQARIDAATDTREDVLGKPKLDPFDIDHRAWVEAQIRRLELELHPVPPSESPPHTPPPSLPEGEPVQGERPGMSRVPSPLRRRGWATPFATSSSGTRSPHTAASNSNSTSQPSNLTSGSTLPSFKVSREARELELEARELEALIAERLRKRAEELFFKPLLPGHSLHGHESPNRPNARRHGR